MKKLSILALIILGLIGCQAESVTGPDNQAIYKMAEIRVFKVSPELATVSWGSTLYWQVLNVEYVWIEPGFGKWAASGSSRVRPDETTTYTLTAGSGKGQVSASVTLTVIPPSNGLH